MFINKTVVAAVSCLVLLTSIPVDASTKLTTACEQALALSALPKRLRDQASVYSWTEGQFKKTLQSDGPFSCIVERNHPEALIPQCVDAAGKDSILPALIFRSEQSLRGKKLAEILEMFQEKVSKGKFVAPPRPGVSYMMSSFNHIYSQRNNRFIDVGPHVMFYAPNLTNEDIGGSFEAGARHNRGVPFIVDPGIHGYMITFTEHASDSAEVEKSCQGQIEALSTRGES